MDDNQKRQREMIFLLQMIVMSISVFALMGFGTLLAIQANDPMIKTIFIAGGILLAFGAIFTVAKSLKRFPPNKMD